MKDSKELTAFLKEYESYVLNILKPTRDEVEKIFKYWKKRSYWGKYESKGRMPSPSPIQRAFSRIKRPESVVDKIYRKPSFFTENLSIDSIHKMNDTLGCRIIAFFLSNLPLIDKELRDSELFEVSEEYPPVAYLNQDLTNRLGFTDFKREDKESGYASIHYTLRLRESVLKKERPWFEIQVRTLAENIWGEVEHILGYKPDKRTSFAVKKQFKILSWHLTAIDEHFNLLYEELSRFQEEVIFNEDDPLNAENLPAVLDQVGAGCAQSEIDGLLKLLKSRGIESVGALLEIAIAKNIEMIRNVHRKHTGSTPQNFDTVASLAAIKDIEEEDKIKAAIEAQIDFLEAWEKIKKDLYKKDNNKYSPKT